MQFWEDIPSRISQEHMLVLQITILLSDLSSYTIESKMWASLTVHLYHTFRESDKW